MALLEKNLPLTSQVPLAIKAGRYYWTERPKLCGQSTHGVEQWEMKTPDYQELVFI